MRGEWVVLGVECGKVVLRSQFGRNGRCWKGDYWWLAIVWVEDAKGASCDLT